jgi:hypothetical protein
MSDHELPNCPGCGDKLEMGVRCYLDVSAAHFNDAGELIITDVVPDNSGAGDYWLGALAFEDDASLYCPNNCEMPSWQIDLGGRAHWESSP